MGRVNPIIMLAIAGVGIYFLMNSASTAQQSGTPAGTIPGGNTAAATGTTTTPVNSQQQATQQIVAGGTFTSPAVTGANAPTNTTNAQLPASITGGPAAAVSQYVNTPYDAAGIYQRLVAASGSYATYGMTPAQWNTVLAQVSPVTNPPPVIDVFDVSLLNTPISPARYWQIMAPYLARLGLNGVRGMGWA